MSYDVEHEPKELATDRLMRELPTVFLPPATAADKRMPDAEYYHQELLRAIDRHRPWPERLFGNVRGGKY